MLLARGFKPIFLMKIGNQLDRSKSTLLKESNSPEFNCNLGLNCYKCGQYSQAKQYYLKAISSKPDYAEAYFNLALIYEVEGAITEAIDNYQKAIEYNPDHLNAYNNIGFLLQKEKKFTKAFTYYHQALELNPQWSGIYNNIGYLFLKQDKLDQALIYFNNAIKLDPKLAIAHYNLGSLWMNNQDYAEAVICFEKVIALQPKNIAAYSDIAKALIKLGKIPQAWEYLAQAISLKPSFVKAWVNRIKNLSGNDVLEKAQLNYASFLEGVLNNQPWPEISNFLYYTYLYRANVWFEYGSYLPALAFYQIAFELNNKDIELYLRLGQSLSKQKKLESAILIYHLALALEPDHPKILFQLASIFIEKQCFEQAINYYEKLLQLSDTSRLSIAPSFAPKNPPIAPQGIYPLTKSWIEASNLKSYVQVIWGKEKVNSENPQNLYLLAAPQEKILHQCAGVNCVSCMKKLCDLFQPNQIQKKIYLCEQNQPLSLEKPETFIAMIPQGRAWIVPQKNHWLISNAIAIITPDNYLLGDISRFYPWRLPGCEKHDLRSHPIFSQEEMPTLENLEGNVVFLSTLAGHVYYHWLIDVIPRLGMMIRRGINLDKIDWFVVNSLQKSYQKETLQALGIPLKKVIESDNHPHIQAQRLIVPSFPGDLDWPLSGTIDFLRETFLKTSVSNQKPYPERIYISRAKSKHRHIVNEPEVLDLITNYGFIPIFLETLAFQEQIALFQYAKYIVAPHGSGLTNLLFSSPETTVIEFFSPRYIRSDYLIISQQLQLKHYYLLGESFECYPVRELMYESPITEDILVKIDQLQSLLKLLFPQN